MPKFKVSRKTVQIHTVHVEAKSKEEAIRRAEETRMSLEYYHIDDYQALKLTSKPKGKQE